MDKGFWRKAKRVWGEREQGSGKKPSTLVLLLLLAVGIIFMLISVKPDNLPESVPEPPADSSEVLARSARQDYKASLERELAAMLRRVRGVGEVAVMISLDGSPVLEYGETREATERETREVDSGGGTRYIRESTERREPVVMRTDGGRESPLVIRESQPGIHGVIVVAEGARNPVVYEQLFRAVQAGLNLSPHRITILPME